MEKKKFKQVTIGFVASVTLFSAIAPSVANADILLKDNKVVSISEQKSIDAAMNYVSSQYADVDINNTGLNSIGDTSKSEEYTLTKEDEKRIDEAVSAYLEISGYNNSIQFRGIGKNWWNSRGFIAGIINVALTAIGIGAGMRSAQAISQLIRANRRNITRVVESQIMKRVGISASGFLTAALDIAGTISDISVGGAIAYGLDKADGRLDGYFMA